MVGLFEGEAAPWKVDGIPRDFSFGEIEPDWDRMTPYVEKVYQECSLPHTHIHDSMYLGDESSSCNADQRSEKVFLWTGERVRKLNGKHASLSFSMHTSGVLHP